MPLLLGVRHATLSSSPAVTWNELPILTRAVTSREMSDAQPESINNLDETKILGYFETIRSTFLIKVAVVLSLKESGSGDKVHLRLLEAAKEINKKLPDANFIKAFELMNPELLLNLQEDAVTGILSGSWVVFEQIIKDLSKAKYTTDAGDISLNYERGIFGFSKVEKADIALFYYLRNGMVHYYGAFHASGKSITSMMGYTTTPTGTTVRRY